MHFLLKRYIERGILSTPIQDLLTASSERIDSRTLVKLSLTHDESFTIDDYIMREKNHQNSLDYMISLTERGLYERIRNFIVKALVSQEPHNPDAPTHLFGLPYRVVDTEIEEGAVILLTPKRYYELIDQECESRQIIFTK